MIDKDLFDKNYIDLIGIVTAIEHIWEKLDETWDGDVRPKNWDETCEHMQVIMEEVGVEYNEYGDLK